MISTSDYSSIVHHIWGYVFIHLSMEISADITSPGSGEHSRRHSSKKMLLDFVLNIGAWILESCGPRSPMSFIALRYPPGTYSPSSLPAACLGPTYSSMTAPLAGEVRVKSRDGYKFSSDRGRQAQYSYGARQCDITVGSCLYRKLHCPPNNGEVGQN